MTPPPSPQLEQALLREVDFLRALAVRLLDDEHLAEDVVQETWVRALQRAPQRLDSLRSWLARVARNVAIDVMRSQSRRTGRERRRAGELEGEADAGADEHAAREAARRAVVAAVLALEEPYRSTILMRFYDDLAPAEMAARLGVPVETVRTRVKRGMAQLRARLDQRFDGGRAAWSAALLPLTRTGGVELAPLGAVLALLVTLGVALELARSGGDEAGAAGEPLARIQEPAAAAGGAPGTPADEGRDAARGALGAAAAELELALVYAEDGRPAAGAELTLAWRGEERTLRSDADGRARVLVPRGAPLALAVPASDTWRATRAELEEALAPGEPWRVALPSQRTLAGRVLDERGAPVADATVELWNDRSTDSDRRDPRAPDHVARADADGRYLLSGLDLSFLVSARAPGLVAREDVSGHVEEPARLDGADLVLVRAATVRGRVLDPAGAPAAGAEVACTRDLGERGLRPGPRPGLAYALRSARALVSPHDGGFALEVPPGPALVVASREDAVSDWLRAEAGAEERELVLRLAPGRALAALVLDAEGRPVADALVSCRGPRRALSGAAPVGGLPRGLQHVRTGPDGRCEFPGRADGGPLLLVAEGPDGARALAGPLEPAALAGPVRLDLAAPRDVRCRVVDAAGRPVPGVEVDARLALPGGAESARAFPSLARLLELGAASSDADGAFALDGLPALPLELELRAGGRLQLERLAAGEDGRELVLGGAADGLAVRARVLDGDGAAPLRRYTVTALAAEGGRRHAVAVDDPEGRVALDLPRGVSWRLWFEAEGRAPRLVAPRAELELRLRPARSLRLLARDADGRPLAYASAWLRDPDGAPLLAQVPPSHARDLVHFGSEGELALHGLPAAPLELLLLPADGGGARRFELDLATLPEGPVELVLPRAAAADAPRLRLELRAADGGALPEGTAVALTLGADEARPQLRATGRWSADGLALERAELCGWSLTTVRGLYLFPEPTAVPVSALVDADGTLLVPPGCGALEVRAEGFAPAVERASPGAWRPGANVRALALAPRY